MIQQYCGNTIIKQLHDCSIKTDYYTINNCWVSLFFLQLKESYRTADVIRIALDKLGLDDDNVEQYSLIQLLAKNSKGSCDLSYRSCDPQGLEQN